MGLPPEQDFEIAILSVESAMNALPLEAFETLVRKLFEKPVRTLYSAHSEVTP